MMLRIFSSFLFAIIRRITWCSSKHGFPCGRLRHLIVAIILHSPAFTQITIMNAASLFGRTLPNFIADSYGPFNGQSAR